MWIFPPSTESFKLLKGADVLKEYTFAKGNLVHQVRILPIFQCTCKLAEYETQFCSKCGVAVMASWPGSGYPPGLNVCFPWRGETELTLFLRLGPSRI